MRGMGDDLPALIERYRPLANTISPHALYSTARADGVSRFHTFILLRELYSFNLEQCISAMRDTGDDPNSP